MRPARRLLLIFCLAILTPGVILGFFGARALIQESLLLDRQIQDRLDAAARHTGLRFESELNEWQQAIRDLARSQTPNPAGWPERLRRGVATPGGAVVLTGSRERPQIHPSGQLLYELSASVDSGAPIPSPLLAQAERLELRDKQYPQAIELYQQLLKGARAPERALILRGLAGTLKKAGREAQAIEMYQLLAKEPSVRLGSLPSDFIALLEITAASTGQLHADRAVDLYRGLVSGRWRLPKESYEFYASQAHAWTAPSAAIAELESERQQKLALTVVTESFLRRPASLMADGRDTAVAFWSDEPFAAIVLRHPFRDFLREGEAAEFVHSIVTPDGQVLAGVRGDPASRSASYAIRNALPLRVAVLPRNPIAMSAVVRRQQGLYAGVLAIVVALLAFGGYFTVRTLRSELAVAQMKSDFVSTVSHEFRSPVAGINQLAEMLRDGRVDDEDRRRDYYEMIVAETRRLRRLVENVLDFSRMEDGRKQYRFEPLEPAPWLRELTEDFKTHLAAAGFEVETDIPVELPAIMADRETLATAVHNLLDNAVKYSHTARSITVAAAADAATLSISVSDCGVGIADEDRSRIFEKFYRGGDLTRQVKGVGLGLNLVQHIVAAHGGTVGFESIVGFGSTFTIRLNHGGSA